MSRAGAHPSSVQSCTCDTPDVSPSSSTVREFDHPTAEHADGSEVHPVSANVAPATRAAVTGRNAGNLTETLSTHGRRGHSLRRHDRTLRHHRADAGPSTGLLESWNRLG